MELKARLTHNFIEIEVNEIKTTLFKSESKQIDKMISNLLSVVEDLASLKEKSLNDIFNEYEQ